MPFYFFHLGECEDILVDAEGRDLGSTDLVVTIALHEARALIADGVRSGTIQLDRYIHVADETGAIVHRLPFADAVQIVGGR